MLRTSDIFSGDESNDDYEVGKEIGRGGFGVVHLCIRMSDQSEFVCKSPTGSESIKQKKLKSEFKILKDLEDKKISNVVKAIELGRFEHDGNKVPVLIMEKVEGDTLNRKIKDPQTAEHTKEILLVVGKCLEKIHEAGYIHRDIKPENIMVNPLASGFEITVIDLGIAAVKEDQNTFALTSSIAATPFYAPPEQSKGTVSIGNDIFGLGATGYYLLIGSEKCKIDANNNIALPYDPKNHFGNINGEAGHLFNVICKATQRKRQDRFATMNEFVSYLEGGQPPEDFPRFIVDGRAFPLKPEIDNWSIGRRGYGASIEVRETAFGGAFISRNQAEISRRGECHFILHHKGTNDTRIGLQQSEGDTRWNRISDKGFPIGPKYMLICFGYSDTPPGKKDHEGNPLLPGPYKVIEYFPPSNTEIFSNDNN